ncbi:sterol regulatory element binding protein [Trichuris trichiura]|uniref:Sterol regulatory element-binding protein cleavage-activating protein n=1 Tax=Trichuris trichiura TaxID=36087 RepID=A0A077Z154_TRITR|nr:sterol regulatory element binding protein [Trichuris trichiura]
MLRRRCQLAEEVAHAYYKYGRFCCSRPYATLAHSLSMVLFLSYPLLCARWFYPSPCVLVKTSNVSYQSNADDLSWLNNDMPVAYIVQVIVHTTTPKDNFSASFSSSHLMRSFFEAAFELRNRTTNLAGCCKESMLSEVWPLHGSPTISVGPTCRLLSPSGLWNHSRHVLLADRRFPNSLHSKKGAYCKGELLIGGTEIPKITDTHWHYAMTVMIIGATADQVCRFRTALTSLGGKQPFTRWEMQNEEDGILHIYYKIKRTWFDYILLVVSYVILLFYLYACSQKIEMVKSKWALAFGAVLTVTLSLLMAAGICVHFQLTRRTWLVELFPYLALVVGMENILCMTRSVVSTPTQLDVCSRVAHGLGIEGWSLTKNFCTGFIVLSFGLLFSNVPEITEFCTIALVGFVADFYMQLFFYAPCLAFDLARFGPRDKATLNDERSRTVAYDLPKYSQVVCPFKAFFGWKSSKEMAPMPPVDEGRKEQKAAKEQSEIRVRVSSAESATHLHQLPLPDCLNRMLAFRQPRYFQKIFMVVVAGWIVWFAVGIQQWVNSVVEPTSHVAYQPTVTVQEEYNTDNPNWQLYRCWADFLESRVSTVNGRFVTVLPPVHLAVQLNEASVANMIRRTRAAQPVIIENRDYKKFLPSKELQIGRRISWLEVQMTVVLLLTCCLFLIVAIFIFYVCFIGGRNCSWKSCREWKRFSPPVDSPRVKGDLFIIDSLPLAFESLGEEYQMLHSLNDNLLLSLSSDCRLVIWNGRTGQAEYSFWLKRPVVHIKPHALYPSSSSMVHSIKGVDNKDAYVWSMTGRGELVAFGLSDGTFRLYNMNIGGNLIFENRLSNVGVTEVLMNGNRVVLARSNGFLDFLELCYSSSALKSVTCRVIRSIRAHAMLINCLQVCNDFVVSGGDDRTAKVCDLSSCTVRHSLYGHNAPVISLATDPPDVAFTCCFEGVLCAWNLNEGRLLWMTDDITTDSLATVSLALSGALLIGYCSSHSLWLWSKCTGHLLSCIKPEEGQKPAIDFGCLFDLPQMVLLKDNVVAIASRRGIQFWDVLSRMMLREVSIEGASQFCPVRCLRRLGEDSVVCVVEDVIHRVPFPVVKV